MSTRGGVLVLSLAALAGGCGVPAHSEREIEQTPAGAAEPQAQALPGEASSPSAAPSPDDVRGKVAEIFGTAVRTPAGHPPEFVTGDFNGDGALDIAVIVKPARGALGQINSPVASWILKDIEPMTTREAATDRRPVRVEPADVLLAVIHGYGAAGWRAPEARQTYLLRHAAGESMKPRPLEELGPVPPARKQAGDVIVQTRNRQRGFLLWTGATYVWHPL